MFHANGEMEAPLTTPTRSRSASIEATSLRSTPTTSTTAALNTGSADGGGGGGRGALDGGGVHSGALDGVPRGLAHFDLGRVALSRWLAGAGETLARLLVSHHDHLPALAVATARGKARVVEDLEQRLVGQRLVGEVAACERGGHHIVELHSPDPSRCPRDRQTERTRTWSPALRHRR